MALRPLYDRVVVGVSDATSLGGIVIAGTKNRTQGRVVAAGDGHVLENGHLRPLTVKVGDLVMFDPRAGYEINVDGESLLMFRESDLLGIIN